jgi:hypothetical protein
MEALTGKTDAGGGPTETACAATLTDFATWLQADAIAIHKRSVTLAVTARLAKGAAGCAALVHRRQTLVARVRRLAGRLIEAAARHAYAARIRVRAHQTMTRRRVLGATKERVSYVGCATRLALRRAARQADPGALPFAVGRQVRVAAAPGQTGIAAARIESVGVAFARKAAARPIATWLVRCAASLAPARHEVAARAISAVDRLNVQVRRAATRIDTSGAWKLKRLHILARESVLGRCIATGRQMDHAH